MLCCLYDFSFGSHAIPSTVFVITDHPTTHRPKWTQTVHWWYFKMENCALVALPFIAGMGCFSFTCAHSVIFSTYCNRTILLLSQAQAGLLVFSYGKIHSNINCKRMFPSSAMLPFFDILLYDAFAMLSRTHVFNVLFILSLLRLHRIRQRMHLPNIEQQQRYGYSVDVVSYFLLYYFPLPSIFK